MTPIQINITISATPELQQLLAKLLATPVEPIIEAMGVEQSEEPTVGAEPTEEPAEVAAPVNYTEVDVRAAMERTRQRIEGDNYKENTGSELYQRWHRPLTAWFKQTAALCGAEKPSALPDSDSRARFIAQCDEVEVINDMLQTPIPL